MRCAEISGDVVASRCDASVRKLRLAGSVSSDIVEKSHKSYELMASSIGGWKVD